jgi:hypothetical protein
MTEIRLLDYKMVPVGGGGASLETAPPASFLHIIGATADKRDLYNSLRGCLTA